MDACGDRSRDLVETAHEPRYPQRRRPGIDDLDGIVLQQLALMQNCDAVGDRRRLIAVMRNEHDGGRQGGADVGDQLVHVGAQRRVEGAERLVEQQHLGFGRERSRNCDPLLLAARQFLNGSFSVTSQLHHLEILFRVRASGSPAHPRHALGERDIVEHTEVRKQQGALKNHAHAAFLRHEARNIRSIHQNLAAGDEIESGHDPQNRALARPARPEDRGARPRRHLERDVVERRSVLGRE